MYVIITRLSWPPNEGPIVILGAKRYGSPCVTLEVCHVDDVIGLGKGKGHIILVIYRGVTAPV